MARRKRYAERLEQPPEEVPAEPVAAREPDEEETDESPQEAALRLQRTVGNRALARLLMQNFSLPGLEHLGPEMDEIAEGETRETGLEGLAGQDPAEHVASFLELEHQLPPEARELVRQSAEIQQGGGGGGGGRTLLGTTLRATARAHLMASQTKQPTAELLELVDRLCDAVGEAFATWQTQAMLVGVVVAGPTASGGVVIGQPLEPLILANGPRNNEDEQRATQTVASVTGEAMLRWSASVHAPGLPWYPSFAALPTPMAPPTPNVPTPLIAMISDVSAFQALGARGGGHPAATAVLDALGFAFPMWQGATVVTNVLATGPVPTYAPPYVPVGPVVGGIGMMTPGGFA
jgi:hypothetical protein